MARSPRGAGICAATLSPTDSRMCLRVGFVLSSTLEFRRHHLAGVIRNRIESSQRSQELDDGLLIIPLQFFKLLGYMVCFAAVPQDGVAKRQRCAIVHQARTQANAP